MSGTGALAWKWLDTLEGLIADDRRGDAADLLSSHPPVPADDPGGHVRVAALAEEVGDLSRAVAEYNLALRVAPDQPDVLLRLGRLRTDQGRTDKALRAYRRLLLAIPEHEVAALEAGRLLEDEGRRDEAKSLYDTLLRHVDAPDIRAALTALERRPQEPALDRRPDSLDGGDIQAPQDSDLIRFASIFAGREGVHARQWVSATGKSGYAPVREPFTPSVARGHLLGAYTVGIYPLRSDRTVHFMALDLDIARFALSRAGSRPGTLERLTKTAHDAACRYVDVAASLGLPAFIEDSGWKGRHVWILFASPVPAEGARRVGALLIERAGELPPEITVELFPKQVRTREGGLGNLIKLPLGVHRVTGRVSHLLQPGGSPVTDPHGFLRDQARVSGESLAEILARENATGHGPPGGKSSPRPRGAETDVGDTAAGEDDEIFQDPPQLTPIQEAPYDPSTDLEYLSLLERCPVLAELVRRIGTHRTLSNEGRLVLTYTLGHLTHGPMIVNGLMAGTLNADHGAFLKTRLRGNPMSCPKIRSRIPDVTQSVPCDCHFREDAGLYPTPLLHLQEVASIRAGAGGAIEVGRLDAERLVMDLLRLRTRMDRTRRLADDMEARLAALMSEQGVKELRTGAGVLRRDEDGALSLTVQTGKTP